jgi:polysaccharide export outer membrane protein
MSQRRMMVVLAGACLLVPMAWAQNKNEAQSQAKPALPAAPAAAQQPSSKDPGSPDYIIGPEDVLKIDVWKEPEMSGTIPVRPDGKISLALVGDVQAAGFTPTQLTADLTTRLKKYLEDPRVTVTVNSVQSQRVFILGQVGRPGAYPLLPDMTVLQALSTAGGLSQYAAADKIYVLRNDGGKQSKIAFQYKQVIKGNKPEQNIVLKSGDTIVVP